MTDAITTLDPTQASGANGQAAASKTSLSTDFDSFLMLLTTQLKNQDPLSPMEPTEFTSQLVQFASVEQEINTNDNLEKLVGIQNATLAASIIGFVGTDVEADGTQVPLQDGKGKFTYDLDQDVKNVVITISDSSGSPILTKAGVNKAGTHEFDWDGKDGNGIQQPDGGYQISVTPVGFDDAATAPTATVHIFGKITGVSMENGTMLSAGDVSIPLDKVLTIKDPAVTDSDD